VLSAAAAAATPTATVPPSIGSGGGGDEGTLPAFVSGVRMKTAAEGVPLSSQASGVANAASSAARDAWACAPSDVGVVVTEEEL